MRSWYDSRFTGLFTLFVRLRLRPHDPAVSMTAGPLPAWYPGDPELGSGGAGWTAEEADLACLGEAIERLQARALPGDGFIESAWAAWPRDEPPVDPARWVLFHPEQYVQKGFPLEPLTADTVCRWVCCREADTGNPFWVPEEMVFLTPRRGEGHRHVHGFSTGLSCGRVGDPVLLRGVQEVIERDALVGGWWGSYAVEEWPAETVRGLLGSGVWGRVDRPNLRYRFYRIRSPFSAHVTLVSQSGQDEEGWVFSTGSACRETRRASWQKALLEAIQGRHCVRRLLGQWEDEGRQPLTVPATFFEHALFYSLHPGRLAGTILEQAGPPAADDEAERSEGVAELRARLGEDRPILFRNLTPPGLAGPFPGWLVLRVVVPGLQPLHGDHRLPFLGGPLWGTRPCSDWAAMPPHPFA
jgi:ribosomal protein S12 methylthiotransferase accessory factor